MPLPPPMPTFGLLLCPPIKQQPSKAKGLPISLLSFVDRYNDQSNNTASPYGRYWPIIAGILPGTLPTYSIFWYSTGSILLEFLPSGSDVRRFLCSVRNKPTLQILLFCKEQTAIPFPIFLCEPTCYHDPYPSRSHNPSVST
jgi:hypothetical protein